MHYTRGASGKETLWSQMLKNRRRWTHQSELHVRWLNAKEVETQQRSGNFISPVADGTVNIFGGAQRLRTSILTREHPERGEQEILQGKSDELRFPTQIQDGSTRDDEEAESDFWTITGEFIYRHHAELRVKLYVSKEESFLVPLKYIDVTRTTSLEHGWKKRIVKCMDRIPKICSTKGKATGRIFMVREDLQGDKKTLALTMSGQICKHMSDAAKKKAKQRCTIEKPKFDNARQQRGKNFN